MKSSFQRQLQSFSRESRTPGLTPRRRWPCSASMKRYLQWLVLTALVCSLPSCGLPGAAVRSTSRLVQSAGGLLGPAAAAAAL